MYSAAFRMKFPRPGYPKTDSTTTNPPMNRWNFTNVWQEVADAYPIFLWETPAGSLTNGLVLHYTFDTNEGSTVTDQSGGALPGVTVEAASPALIEKVAAAASSRRASSTTP